MKKYKVIANDDAMKYQVIDSHTLRVKYEHDGENIALEICNLMNEALEQGKQELLDFISS
jgi:hypothetical protein